VRDGTEFGFLTITRFSFRELEWANAAVEYEIRNFLAGSNPCLAGKQRLPGVSDVLASWFLCCSEGLRGGSPNLLQLSWQVAAFRKENWSREATLPKAISPYGLISHHPRKAYNSTGG